MRLIDADALWDELTEDLNDGDVLYSIPPCYIDDAPTVDAVPVVRCGECKHYRPKASYTHCAYPGGMLCPPDANGFCSYGQHRDQPADVRKKEGESENAAL